MPQQGFMYLDQLQLEAQLNVIFRHWGPSWLERAEFIAWAWVVATAADRSAEVDRARAVAKLREERDIIHHGLSELVVTTSVVNLKLVAQRMFLDWLAEELERVRIAA